MITRTNIKNDGIKLWGFVISVLMELIMKRYAIISKVFLMRIIFFIMKYIQLLFYFKLKPFKNY